MARDGSMVIITSTSYVKPARATKRHLMYLAEIDRLFGDLPYTRHLYFYDVRGRVSSGEDDMQELVEGLKRSLARTLVEFYPMAGRAVKNGRHLQLDCNDEGVEFLEGCSHLSFRDFQEDGFMMGERFQAFAGLGDRLRGDEEGEPLLSIQVTRLSDGGLVLGTAMSHLLVDGYSFWHFIDSWCQLSRGRSTVATPPLHLRAALKPDVLSLHTYITPAHADTSTLPTVAPPEYSPPPPANTPAPGHDPPPATGTSESLRQVIWHVPADAVRRLKEDAGGHASTFAALSAYLWKRLTRAQRLPAGQRVGLMVPVDVRQRLLPPLTQAFFGNAVVPALAVATAGQLGSEDLAATTTRVASSTSHVDHVFARDFLTNSNDPAHLASLFQGLVITNVSNSPKFPCYNLDFGWGAPVVVRPVIVRRENLLDLYPAPLQYPNGSLEVCLAFHPTTLEDFASSDLPGSLYISTSN